MKLGIAVIAAFTLALTAGSGKATGGALSAGFSDVDQGVFWPGVEKRSRLVIRNGGSEHVRDIVVRVRSHSAAVTEITSPEMNWRRTREGWLAALAGMAPGAAISATLTVRLDDAGERDFVGAVDVSIAPRRAEQPIEARAQWTVSNCASAYYRDLTAIRATAEPRMAAAMAAVKKGDPALPGEWLFPPASARVAKELSAADRRARAVIRARGDDPYLRSDPVEWLSGRLAQDLRRYLGQEPSAGLCAPVDPMFDYLGKQLRQLDGRMSAVSSDRAAALAAARQATVDALAAIRRAAVANPAAELAADTPEPGNEARSRELFSVLTSALNMHKRVAAAVQTDAPANGADPIASLIAAKPALMAHPALRGGKPTQLGNTVFAALTAIERAAYLERLEARYGGFYGAFADTISGIRAANAKSCTCQY